MKTALLFIGLLGTVASGIIYADNSSQITLVVSDQDGDRLPGVSATFTGWSEKTVNPAPGAKTDALGKSIHTILLPEQKTRGFEIEVKKNGYYTQTVSAVAAPGAKLITEVTLNRRLLTTLQFREVDGSPAAHCPVYLQSSNKVYTDERGEFTFSHPVLKESMSIAFGGENFSLTKSEAGKPKEIRLTGIEITASIFSFLPQVFPPTKTRPRAARVSGKLLKPDGQPALGWLVAKLVTKGNGSWSGSILVMGHAHYNFFYRNLTPVADDGSFELDPAFTDLMLISPEGMPFRYPLNPGAWPGGGGLKETTITVPEVGGIGVKLRLESEEGKPAVGYRAVPSVGQSYDNWELRPRISEQRDSGYYANSAPPPTIIDSLTSVAISNEQGEIAIPVHPWRPLRWMALHSPDKDYRGRWNWPPLHELKDGDTIVYKRYENALPPGAKNDFRDLIITSMKDSDGRKIDPERVRWNFSAEELWGAAGKGGFVQTDGGYKFAIASGGKGHLSFEYRNSRGVMNRKAIHFDAIDPLPNEIAIKLEREKEKDPPSLSGKVLGHDGKPLEGVRLHLIDENATDANKKYLQLMATSNRAGEFSFDKAPGECGMTVAARWEGHNLSIDDSIEIPKVTPDNRKLELKMKPTGSLTIKLVGAKILPPQLMLFEPDDEQESWEELRLRDPS